MLIYLVSFVSHYNTQRNNVNVKYDEKKTHTLPEMIWVCFQQYFSILCIHQKEKKTTQQLKISAFSACYAFVNMLISPILNKNIASIPFKEVNIFYTYRPLVLNRRVYVDHILHTLFILTLPSHWYAKH